MTADVRPERRFRFTAWLLSAAVIVVGGLAYWLAVVERGAPVTFLVAIDPAEALSADPAGPLAVSPDGSSIAFVGATTKGPDSLYIWTEREFASHVLAGTEHASGPFFSPDGQWLGFAAQGRLMKIPIGGGSAVPICALDGPLRGASWAPDGRIYFGLAAAGDGSAGPPLRRVDAAGGAPQAALALMNDERWQAWPQVLADRSHLLYISSNSTAADRSSRVYVRSLVTGERRELVQADMASATTNGRLVYATAAGIFSARFETSSLTLSAAESLSGAADSVRSGRGFAAGPNGTVVLYNLPSPPGSMLVWVDRQGKERPVRSQREDYATAALSPDGRRIAFGLPSKPPRIWIYDVETDAVNQAPHAGKAADPVWAPDGLSLTFRGHLPVDSAAHVYLVSLGGGMPVPLIDYTGRVLRPSSWSGDGQQLALEVSDGGLAYYTASDKQVRPIPIPGGGRASSPQLSADGRWLAYAWDGTGQAEIHVQSFPSGAARVRVSRDGGTQPHWSRDGRELFYLSGARLLSVSMTAAGAPSAPPSVLATGPYSVFDVAPDGQRFLAITADSPTANSLTVVRRHFR